MVLGRPFVYRVLIMTHLSAEIFLSIGLGEADMKLPPCWVRTQGGIWDPAASFIVRFKQGLTIQNRLPRLSMALPHPSHQKTNMPTSLPNPHPHPTQHPHAHPRPPHPHFPPLSPNFRISPAQAAATSSRPSRSPGTSGTGPPTPRPGLGGLGGLDGVSGRL